MSNNNSTFTVTKDTVTYLFGSDGFIRKATIDGFNGTTYDVNNGDFSRMRITLADERGELVPYTTSTHSTYEHGESLFVEFPEILWKDQQGNQVPDFRLSLRYELLSSGRAFVYGFFYSNNAHSPAVNRFSLNYDWACSAFKDVRWAAIPRPKHVDGAMIQAQATGRGLQPGGSRHLEAQLLPSVSMNLRAASGECAYFESILEGANSLSGDCNDNFTDLIWQDNGDFHTEYSFIRNTPCVNKPIQIFQWRNQWGWIIKTPDKVRHLPPFNMHHYFDNYLRYPTNECLENLARQGADVLIIHENWRVDIQNGGTPYRPEELRRVIDKAHALGMRIALYMRGNERSTEETACNWFDELLQKDRDGLYMDYGGPYHLSMNDESYPDGKINFRIYLTTMENLRKRVGRDGIFYGHTGTGFSAIWYASGGCDGYVSGEGERGVMVSNRDNHSYFSMAPVGPGTMWTGAFPAYSTSRMRPFLAATGQYPHSPLGEQFLTSSLAHPREPGVNDTAFRPLWKIWRLFRNEKDINILNDYNSSGVFQNPCTDIGHYLMVSADRKRALLIVSNFATERREFTLELNRALVGFDAAGMKAFRLAPTEAAPGSASAVAPDAPAYDFALEANDVAALYFDLDEKAALAHVADFERPYPELSADNKRYLELLDEQKRFRNDQTPRKQCYVQLTVPNTNLSYEFSMVYDLYLNSMALVEFMPDGTKKRWGWISKQGFVTEEPKPEDFIWPDVYSPRVALHEILPPGPHHIGIESSHCGDPFYSFCSAQLTDDAEGTNPRNIYFRNELEPERQFLRWHINLA